MLNNKTIWITGASSGIGKAMTLALAAQGNHVIASARSAEPLAAMAAQVSAASASHKGQITPLVCDVSDPQSMAAAATEMSNITDQLNAVIVNAGTCEYVDLPQWQPAMFERVFDANLQGAVKTLEVALPLLRKAPRGQAQIVAVSSLSTLLPFPRAEAYGASKAALEYMMNTLRIDLVPSRIAVTVVRPGFVATPLTQRNDFPMPFIITPERAADEIIWAMAKRKKSHAFPKRLAWLLGGINLLGDLWPAVLAPKLARKQQSTY